MIKRLLLALLLLCGVGSAVAQQLITQQPLQTHMGPVVGIFWVAFILAWLFFPA